MLQIISKRKDDCHEYHFICISFSTINLSNLFYFILIVFVELEITVFSLKYNLFLEFIPKFFKKDLTDEV